MDPEQWKEEMLELIADATIDECCQILAECGTLSSVVSDVRHAARLKAGTRIPTPLLADLKDRVFTPAMKPYTITSADLH